VVSPCIVASRTWGISFEPPYSTESDIRATLEGLGHTVTALQEQDVDWPALPETVAGHDLLLWTRTHSLDRPPDRATQTAILNRIRESMPVVGYHLDRFWGLTARSDRELWVRTLPYFQDTDVVFTADGGNDEAWEKAGVTHVHMPPAVARRHVETVGAQDPRFVSDVGFVGSWRDYHPEWRHRRELVEWAQRQYRSRMRIWEGGIRGQDLANLYATVKILIGDSCLLGPNYTSDRIPETLGRGGFLLHPDTPGLRDLYPEGTLVTWPLRDWQQLRWLIDYYLSHEDERVDIAAAGRQLVLARHLYDHRIATMFDTLSGRGLL